jgi:hypothetical protein
VVDAGAIKGLEFWHARASLVAHMSSVCVMSHPWLCIGRCVCTHGMHVAYLETSRQRIVVHGSIRCTSACGFAAYLLLVAFCSAWFGCMLVVVMLLHCSAAKHLKMLGLCYARLLCFCMSCYCGCIHDCAATAYSAASLVFRRCLIIRSRNGSYLCSLYACRGGTDESAATAFSAVTPGIQVLFPYAFWCSLVCSCFHMQSGVVWFAATNTGYVV